MIGQGFRDTGSGSRVSERALTLQTGECLAPGPWHSIHTGTFLLSLGVHVFLTFWFKVLIPLDNDSTGHIYLR